MELSGSEAYQPHTPATSAIAGVSPVPAYRSRIQVVPLNTLRASSNPCEPELPACTARREPGATSAAPAGAADDVASGQSTRLRRAGRRSASGMRQRDAAVDANAVSTKRVLKCAGVAIQY